MKKKSKVRGGDGELAKRTGLCFRCEERALFLETGNAPRCECQTPAVNASTCYMYKPVRPVITQVARGYAGRPRLAPIAISAREEAVGVAVEMELQVVAYPRKRICLYWKP